MLEQQRSREEGEEKQQSCGGTLPAPHGDKGREEHDKDKGVHAGKRTAHGGGLTAVSFAAAEASRRSSPRASCAHALPSSLAIIVSMSTQRDA